MKFGEYLIISDSLARLIQNRRSGSACLNILHEGLMRLVRGRSNRTTGLRKRAGTRLLNSKFPGNYFSYREMEGLISYMPHGKTQVVNPDNTWQRKGRQSMKPGRWIRAMLNPRLAKRMGDEFFAEFNDIVRHEELKNKMEFKLISVKDGYNHQLFDYNSIGSCMWNKDVSPFYDAFGCQVLVGRQAGNTVWSGRALVWPDVKISGVKEKVTFMDRIYATSQEVKLAFVEYAASQGWFRKLEQNRHPDAGVISPDGVLANRDQLITAKTASDLKMIAFYPYLDTLCYGGENWVSNNDESDWIYKYQVTTGGREVNHAGQVQDVDGHWIARDMAVVINGDYYNIQSDHVVTCFRTEDYILRRDSVFIDCPGVDPGGGSGFHIHRRFVRSGIR